jgi:hypothetical protein
MHVKNSEFVRLEFGGAWGFLFEGYDYTHFGIVSLRSLGNCCLSREQSEMPTLLRPQGSEFPAVVIPLATQHYMLLQRNLIYTGITRSKRLLVLVGQRKALAIAVRNDRPQRRYSGLLASLRGDNRAASV